MLDILGMPLAGAAHAGAIDDLIGYMHWLMLVIFVGWGAFYLYLLFRFSKARHPRADYHGTEAKLSKVVEAAIVLVEVILLVGFSIPFWAQAVDKLPPENEALTVRVVAETFKWNFHYAGADGKFGKTDVNLIDSQSNFLGLDPSDPNGKDDIVVRDRMYLPVGKPVILKISSKDVIHSFGVMSMRLKQDAIPGMVVPIWFKPTVTTEEMRQKIGKVTVKTNVLEGDKIVEKFEARDFDYEIACSQLCGSGHAKMRGTLEVMDQAGFDKKMAELGQAAGKDEW